MTGRPALLAETVPFNRELEQRGLLYGDLFARPATEVLVPLAAALARLSASGRDLILLTSNMLQYDLSVNLVASLAALGLRHYLLLADNAALVAHAQRRGAVACAWSSALERFAVGPQNHLWWKASFWSFLNLRLQ